jgi:hypothetical protein
MPCYTLRIVLLLYCYVGSFPVTAQSLKGDMEASLNYGRVSGTQVILFTELRSEDSYYENTGSSATYFADFRYYLGKNVAFGLTAGEQWINYQFINTGQKIAQPRSFPLNGSIVTVAGELKGAYVNLRYFQLYGLLGLGVRFFNMDASARNDWTPAFILSNTQWTPLGLRFGNSFGAFAEFGIGYKGLLNTGISYRLSGAKQKTNSSKNQ